MARLRSSKPLVASIARYRQPASCGKRSSGSFVDLTQSAHKFTRLLQKSYAAMDIGKDACLLLVYIAHTEDADKPPPHNSGPQL